MTDPLPDTREPPPPRVMISLTDLAALREISLALRIKANRVHGILDKGILTPFSLKVADEALLDLAEDALKLRRQLIQTTTSEA